MYCDAIIYRPDGTSSLCAYRGEPFSAVKRHARDHVASGYAVRVDIRDPSHKQLLAQFPRVTRPYMG